MESHLIRIRKPAHKFTAAHMTVFPDGGKERLHGHNFEVELQVRVVKSTLAQMISFSVFNAVLRELCEGWDERLILARQCPQLKILQQTNDVLEFSLCSKRYAVPAEDVAWIEADNVTTEALAEIFCKKFVEALQSKVRMAQLASVSITVFENPGQGAAFEWSNPTCK